MSRLQLGGSIIRKLFSVMSVGMLGKAANFVAGVLLARKLGVDGFASFSMSLAVFQLSQRFSPLGWPAIIPRQVVEYLEAGEHSLLFGLIRRASHIAIAVSGLSGILIWLFTPLLIREKFGGEAVMVMLALGPMLLAVRRVWFRLMIALGRSLTAVFIDNGLVPCGMLVLVLSIARLDVVVAIGCFLAFSAVALLCLYLSSQVALSGIPNTSKSYDPDWWTSAWSTTLGDGATLLLIQGTTLILSFSASATEISHYSIGVKFGLIFGTLPVLISAVFESHFALAAGKRDTSILRGLFRKSMACSTLVAVVPLVVLLLFAPHVLQCLFGPSYKDAASILRIIVLGQAVNAATGPVNSLLLVVRKEVFIQRSAVVCCGVSMISVILLANAFGAIGAAVGTAGASIWINLWRLREASKSLVGGVLHA